LIRKLQSDPKLTSFYLVGETALALQIGHRISIDIDLFTRNSFDQQEYLEHLEENYDFELQFMHQNTLKGFIKGVFIDLLRHDYPFVVSTKELEGIKMLSQEDITAMKVNAISGNGTRVKDFIDIYFLLKTFSFGDILGFYKKKYGNRNEFHALKSLSYFNDIIIEDWPNMVLEKGLTMEKLKASIIEARDGFLDSKQSWEAPVD